MDPRGTTKTGSARRASERSCSFHGRIALHNKWRKESMSYTYLNVSDIGQRFRDAPVGTDEGNAAMAELFAIYEDCGVEAVSTGWSGALGKIISIQTAPDAESATRCQVALTNAGLVEGLLTGPYTSLEDLIAMQM